MVLEIKYLEDIANIDYGTRVVKSKVKGDEYPVYGGGGETFRINKYNRENCVVISRFAMSQKCTRYVNEKIFLNDSGLTVSTKDNSKLLQEYLDWYILSKNDEIYSLGRGAGQRNLEIPSFKRMLISYHTNLEEQQKIISQLKLADEIRIKKRLANDKLDEFLKSTFISMFGDPVKNENSFDIRCLKEFYLDDKSVKCGPFGSALKKLEYTNSGIPVWNMDNILPHSEFCKIPNLYITEKKYRELESYNVKNNDIIISRAGTVGKMCVVENIETNSIISTNLIRLRLNDAELLPIWFVKLLEYQGSRVCRLKTGADGAFTHMNTGILDNIYFPYPSIEQQNKFAKIVEKVETQKQKNELVIEQMNNLFNSLSQKAFKGEL